MRFTKGRTCIDFNKSDAYNYRDTECYNEMLSHNIIMNGYIPLYFTDDSIYLGHEDDGHIWFDLLSDYTIPKYAVLDLIESLLKVVSIDEQAKRK